MPTTRLDIRVGMPTRRQVSVAIRSNRINTPTHVLRLCSPVVICIVAKHRRLGTLLFLVMVCRNSTVQRRRHACVIVPCRSWGVALQRGRSIHDISMSRVRVPRPTVDCSGGDVGGCCTGHLDVGGDVFVLFTFGG